MIFWIDAQLSPSLAEFLVSQFGVEAKAVRELGLRDAEDLKIFMEARSTNAIIISKDRDFVELLTRLGPPPQVLWLTCGNTSNLRLRRIFEEVFPSALQLLKAGEPLVEIQDA